ncbi:MAG: sulfatase-like hydrolase/transferase [Lutimonas sp.]
MVLSCDQKASSVNKKPNIVFILTDDQTYNSIHALGNNEIATPAIDKLVNAGTTFTSAYNMGSWSGAVCVASRTMLNSGRTVWRANEYRKMPLDSNKIEKTWSRILAKNGYQTYMTGKWHVEVPVDSVFKTVKHERPGMPKDTWDHDLMVAKFDSLITIGSQDYESIMPVGYNRPKGVNDKSWSPSDSEFGGFWKGGKHWSEVLKDDAIQFIDSAKLSEDPFFMYLAFNAPHDPRQAPESFLSRYSIDQLSVPKSFLPEYPYRNGIQNGNQLRDEALAPFPRTEYAIKKHIQEYYASITYTDYQIGLILEALQKSVNMDNTYIIFTSDHGLAMGRHGLLGKQNLFDHSIRAPLIIVGPDIPKSEMNNSDVYIQDIMATTLEIAGIDKPSYIEFNSFLDQAKEKKQNNNYDAIYGAYLNVQRMIRKDGFKLIVYPEINKILLFDLKNDPEEMVNLSNEKEYAKKVKLMFEDLIVAQYEMEDPLDLSTFYRDYFDSY